MPDMMRRGAAPPSFDFDRERAFLDELDADVALWLRFAVIRRDGAASIVLSGMPSAQEGREALEPAQAGRVALAMRELADILDPPAAGREASSALLERA